jgi:hypothetical protein
MIWCRDSQFRFRVLVDGSSAAIFLLGLIESGSYLLIADVVLVLLLSDLLLKTISILVHSNKQKHSGIIRFGLVAYCAPLTTFMVNSAPVLIGSPQYLVWCPLFMVGLPLNWLHDYLILYVR